MLRVELRFVEVLCSDDALYKDRMSRRTRHIEGFPELTWEGVLQHRADLPVDRLRPPRAGRR